MGAGKIAQDFATAMKSLPKGEHEIVAVAARDLKRAQEFADNFGVKYAVESYEYVANCEEVDVVYVNVVNPNHLDLVKLAMNGNKAVLCEKPLGMNSKQVREMLDLARQKKVFFMEAFWSRCFPIYEEIRQSLREGKIGEPKFIQGSFGIQMDPQDMARVFEKKLGGSRLIDLGCYLIMCTTMMFNGQRPQAVHAWGKLNKEGVDILDCISLKYKDDVYAQLMLSAETNMSQKFQVFGSKGQLELPGWFNSPSKVIVNDDEIEHPLPDVKEHFHYPNSQGLAYEAKHVRECLLQGLKESPVMPLEHTDIIVSITDEVRRQVGVTFPEDKQ